MRFQAAKINWTDLVSLHVTDISASIYQLSAEACMRNGKHLMLCKRFTTIYRIENATATICHTHMSRVNWFTPINRYDVSLRV